MAWLKWGMLALAAVIVLGVASLWLMGKRAGAGQMRSEIRIARSPQVVWRWLEDKDKFAQWVSWVVKVEDSGPEGVGHRRRVTMRDANNNNQEMTLEFETTTFEAGRRVSERVLPGNGFSGQLTYTLEADGAQGSVLRTKSEWIYEGLMFQLLEPLITPSAQEKETKDLARLKELVEAAP
jgi:uncharacterized protein YndB with AHSA1/START domain